MIAALKDEGLSNVVRHAFAHRLKVLFSSELIFPHRATVALPLTAGAHGEGGRACHGPVQQQHETAGQGERVHNEGEGPTRLGFPAPQSPR